MSNLPMRDAKIDTGTWLLVGAGVIALGAMLFGSANAVASLIVVKAPGRLVKMPGGSTPENLARVVAAFGPLVTDQGNGIYNVHVLTDVTATLPGAKVL